MSLKYKNQTARRVGSKRAANSKKLQKNSVTKGTKKQGQPHNKKKSKCADRSLTEQEFFCELTTYGIPAPKKLLAVGKFTRWGDNQCYWAIKTGDGYCFGDWSIDLNEKWFPQNESVLTPAQKRERKAAIEEAMKEVERLRQEQQAEAAEEATDLWDSFYE